jgi:hypothetical protein
MLLINFKGGKLNSEVHTYRFAKLVSSTIIETVNNESVMSNIIFVKIKITKLVQEK